MTEPQDVDCRPAPGRALPYLIGLGAAGVVLAAVRAVLRGTIVDGWALGGLSTALVGLGCLYVATTRVSADAHGIHSRTLLRRRNTPWRDIDDLGVYIQYGRNQEIHRVCVMLRDGNRRRLPLPMSGSSADRAEFDARLDALRALHRRHGDPRSSHVPVLSSRTAGRGSVLALLMCALLLGGAGLAAWLVPIVQEERAAWRSATACPAGTPASRRGECRSTGHAVIARAEVTRGRGSSWLYFADGRPLERLAVSREGARGFRPGDEVRVTVWRHQVREVIGHDHAWREHFTGSGEVAVIAAGCALAAGWPGARVLQRRRGRRLPDDEVLPSALPFTGAIVGTALWLLPLCYRHPTSLSGSSGVLAWAVSGSVVSLGLFTWAWHATRVRAPQDTAPAGGRASAGDEFVTARFLDHTDYNPNGFGSHIALGDGTPAVVPGRGRFAARRIPADRLTLKAVRRVRGCDGDTVPRSWHIAELDDAGRPVRLAAAPADLLRVTAELERAGSRRDPAMEPGPSGS
ncbi:PH domain-containing protein [Streptomyces sp. NPDC053728]|uniref:PH domain-containing protein n=1 Tax=Streptomyces sp. NPDC053728 TaxID=3155534 RepID=UPI00341F4161